MLGFLTWPLAAAAAPTVPTIFAAENTQGVEGDRSVVLPGVFYFFHDGTFDLYDLGAKASPTIAVLANGLAGYYVADTLVPAFRAAQPEGHVSLISHGLCYATVEAFEYQFHGREQLLDPQKHRYLSYLVKVFPSDDAFVANDNPKAHEVFDREGKFLGPVVIELTGDDVLDAGTRLNDETDIPQFDIVDDVARGVATDDVIRKHPGFNGSSRNPTGAPKRILGGVAQYILGNDCSDLRVDPVLGDFSHSTFDSLNRFRLTSRLSSYFSGVWYNPALSGEGFAISVFDALAPKLSFSWYTYAPDGSGKQKWLFGSGPIDQYSAEVVLFETEGGVMGSDQNPQLVQSRRWGKATVGFVACDAGLVDVQPDDPLQNRGVIPFQRLTAVPAGSQRACGDFSLSAPSAPPLPPAFGE